jgi:hypothetical protein
MRTRPALHTAAWSHPVVPAAAFAAGSAALAAGVARGWVVAGAAFWVLLGTAAGYALSGSV